MVVPFEDLHVWEFYQRDSVGPTMHICAVGDVGFSGRIGQTIFQQTCANLFQDVAPFLKSADVSFCNLETPLLSDWVPDKMFAGDLQSASLLAEAGFTHIHLANNHIYDYGPVGLASTLQACETSGLIPLGATNEQNNAQSPARVSKKGIELGWLACGRTLKKQEKSGPFYWEYDEEELIWSVKKLRSEVDVLIVSIHIGLMYLDYPSPELKLSSERLVDVGADLILMHHAHILQGVRNYSGGVICYNLGNFLFDWNEGNVQSDFVVVEQQQGGVFSIELDKRGICKVCVLPIYVDADLLVRWATGARGQAIIDRLKRISADLDDMDYSSVFLKQRIERNAAQAVKVIWFNLLHGNWSVVAEYLKRVRWPHFVMGVRLIVSKTRNALFS